MIWSGLHFINFYGSLFDVEGISKTLDNMEHKWFTGVNALRYLTTKKLQMQLKFVFKIDEQVYKNVKAFYINKYWWTRIWKVLMSSVIIVKCYKCIYQFRERSNLRYEDFFFKLLSSKQKMIRNLITMDINYRDNKKGLRDY